MKLQTFLEHHGIASNPFADEDARTDLVFKGYCISNTYHPTWDKIYGNPIEPATAVVFGEKGAGKTALRLQIVDHLATHNAEDSTDGRTFVIDYDDFNSFLDRFRERFSGRRRKIDRVLSQWKIWDHIDAILALGVTQLVDRILKTKSVDHPAASDTKKLRTGNLDKSQVRDLLLLAACYDQSGAETGDRRWRRLARKLGYSTWKARWDFLLGLGVTAGTASVIVWQKWWDYLSTPWPYAIVAASWLPYAWRGVKACWRGWRVIRNTRTLNPNHKRLRKILRNMSDNDLAGQPLPRAQRSDDRYEMLAKFQQVLTSLGFPRIIVLVDRVDEPYLINGSSELMRELVWPMLDNKLLKHPGLGLKLFLPAELIDFTDRESKTFHQRARLDKQNLIRSLDWTGESLYDVAGARLQACAKPGQSPALSDLLDESISNQRLIEALSSLRVPRHLFKFLYRLMVAHTNTYTTAEPSWRISAETFETQLALYQREATTYA
jgi:hypothetical protein